MTTSVTNKNRDMVFCSNMVFCHSMEFCVVRDVMHHESCYFRQVQAVSTAKQCGAKRPGPLEPQWRFTATKFHCNGVSLQRRFTATAFQCNSVSLRRRFRTTDKNQTSKLATNKNRASKLTTGRNQNSEIEMWG